MAAILSSLAIAAMLVLLAREYWFRLFDTEGPTAHRQFFLWTCKGLGVPMVVWILINCGLVPGMPILVPEIALTKSRGGHWIQLLARRHG